MEQRKLGLATYRQVFWRYLRPHIGRVALLAVVLLSSIGLQLIRPQIVRGFIDQAQQQAALERLIWAAAAYLVLGLVAQGADLLAMYLSTDLGFAATNTMREDLTAHCLRLSMAFHNDRTPGEMIERIDGDVTALSNFFSQFVIRLLGSALLIIGVLIALYLEDWRVGVALTLFVVVSFVVLMSMRDAAVKESEQEREASAEMYGFLEERLEGLDDIRANGASRYTMNRFHERIREYYQAGLRAFRARTVIWRTAMFVFGQGQVLALLVAALLYTQGFITIGTIYLLYAYTGMLLDPLEQIVHQIQDLQKAAAGIQRTTELLMRDDRVPDGERNDVPSGALDLTFDGVHFGYEDDEPVFRGYRLISNRAQNSDYSVARAAARRR